MKENETNSGTGANTELMEIPEGSSYSWDWPCDEDPTSESRITRGDPEELVSAL